ncbi:/ macB / Macrolide export ATP-binding/permease protein MacB /:26819 Forward [Candidatus Hepatoplasma crinochetorum]|uniref:/ macB / Macrolide export ATP-binding/permease protein MacB /:26819 Forward n=1 Tax=Candidatus Hepatoplasma crinochetorum TaxID=295596 RepID=A0A0G7ZNI6_9MOLU|nr:/ macB / Macrolide export ATP-binding/permease protein MacB /:26819 Forward [Candidatus Hepatoplasma crinochetorum]
MMMKKNPKLNNDDEKNINKEDLKKLKNLAKDRIKKEKKEYKEKIANAINHEQKGKIKKEAKNLFKKGILPENSFNKKYIVELKDVEKYYFMSKSNYEHILRKINLKIKEGEVVIILGMSGSGKTTLLNIISGLTDFNKGSVRVLDHDLFYLSENKKTKFRANHVSFVFQSYNLIQSLTVSENIKIGENLRSKSKEKIDVDQILASLDLSDQKNKYPFQLSGGQQQRVSIGRALAKNPTILFADEPTGALDEEKGKDAMRMILNINKIFKTTLIIVTHNPNFANIGDHVIRIKDGQIIEDVYNKKRVSVSDVKWT